MNYDDKSSITLMEQSAHTVYCYYNISSKTIKEFEDVYGENSWKDSKPVLVVYKEEEGNREKIDYIYIDPFANNWFIKLKDSGIKIFVKLCRELKGTNIATIAISNSVISLKDAEATEGEIKYIDIFENMELKELCKLERTEEGKLEKRLCFHSIA